MLFYIILRHLKGVWENVMSYNILHLFFIKSYLGQMLCLFIKYADVMYIKKQMSNIMTYHFPIHLLGV